MAIFRRSTPDQGPAPDDGERWVLPAASSPPAVVTPVPGIRERVAQLSPAIDGFLGGRVGDSGPAIFAALGASIVPHHFPEQSVWARSVVFADEAIAAGEYLIAAKLYQFCAYWHDAVYPELMPRNPGLVQMYGTARPQQRSSLQLSAFDAATRLPLTTVVDPNNGETIGEILFVECRRLGRSVDYLADSVTVPPEPTARERMDKILQLARDGNPGAVLYEQALGAATEDESLAFLEQAAETGFADAMNAAAELCHSASNLGGEKYWADRAAHAGSVRGMMRLVSILFSEQRYNEAEQWLVRAGRAGDTSAYELLANFASESGHVADAERWARAGSDAGNAECARILGAILHSQSSRNIAKAHALFAQAAQRGSVQAMFDAHTACVTFKSLEQARYWLEHAASLGHEESGRKLDAEG